MTSPRLLAEILYSIFEKDLPYDEAIRLAVEQIEIYDRSRDRKTFFIDKELPIVEMPLRDKPLERRQSENPCPQMDDRERQFTPQERISEE